MNKEARSAASPLAQVWLFRFDHFSRRQGKRRIDFYLRLADFERHKAIIL